MYETFRTLVGALLLAAAASAQWIGFGVHGNMFNSSFNEKIKSIANITPAPTAQAQVAIDQVYGLGLGGGVHVDFGLLGILKIRVSGDYSPCHRTRASSRRMSSR